LHIRNEECPPDALLRTYRGGAHPERWGGYGDCFSVSIDRVVALADFVTAFYTSPLFRVERFLLRLILGVRSSDADAHALGIGSAKSLSFRLLLRFHVVYSEMLLSAATAALLKKRSGAQR